jgi:hypothetical protein
VGIYELFLPLFPEWVIIHTSMMEYNWIVRKNRVETKLKRVTRRAFWVQHVACDVNALSCGIAGLALAAMQIDLGRFRIRI